MLASVLLFQALNAEPLAFCLYILETEQIFALIKVYYHAQIVGFDIEKTKYVINNKNFIAC